MILTGKTISFLLIIACHKRPTIYQCSNTASRAQKLGFSSLTFFFIFNGSTQTVKSNFGTTPVTGYGAPTFPTIASNFTDELKFTNAASYESIPIYRVLDSKVENEAIRSIEVCRMQRCLFTRIIDTYNYKQDRVNLIITIIVGR